ncbi:murein biosynthesis integral membrane protein MurJ [Anaerosalibacter massiliensis]|uniref:Probable lipid II flippase MurJ n=1 Tax=Anaerosalibacter massiliensis TaxID=1347392 RepID=A0A9X2S8T4_9FIRM|nr:murein biosynthesis integral membrane protein MurJ [Anaerosalibacter massiliensis]MCR2045376.1 murein biosynthesis integral membrane protein MurJ [Anaerosalibacter massiliensis]
MSKAKKAAKSAAIIMFFTLTSKFLGFLREVLIAKKFGSGWETDTYFMAMIATTMIMTIVGSAINTTVIPLFSEIEVKHGKDRKIDYMNNMLNVVFFLAVILMILGWLFSPAIMKVVARGFEGKQFELAVKLNRVGLPIILFMGTTFLFKGFLESSESFTAPAAMSLPFNLIYIGFLLIFSNKYGIVGLMVASVVAALSQIIIQIPSAKKIGYKYKFKIDLKDRYLKKTLILTIPVLIGSAINEINVIVDKALASNLTEGSISALNYASRINSIVLGVFVTAIATVIFPMLSKESNRKNIDSLKEIMGHGINIVLIITIPAMVGLILFAEPFVRIFFQRGAFDSIATLMTSQAVIFYSIGMVAMALNIMLNKVYYSLQDTRTPMINGGISVGINIVLNLILVKFMGHRGLALATSIASIFTTLLLINSLRKKLGNMNIKSYLSCFLKSAIASVIMGTIAYAIYNGLYPVVEGRKILDLFIFLLSVGVGAVIYFILCYLFKIEEINFIIDKVKVKIKKI